MREAAEVELKYLLGCESDLEKLVAALPGFFAELNQQNIYLDDGGILRKNDCLFRIRIENGSGEVTLKVAGGLVDGVSSAVEFTESLTEDSLEKIGSGEFSEAFRGMNCLEKVETVCGQALTDLKEWGRIRNLRRCFRLDQGWIVEVDRAVFPDGTIRRELELESESPQAAKEAIEPILEELKIPWQQAVESKSCQLFRILDGATG